MRRAIIEAYDTTYKIMVISDILKENGIEWDCYEDMFDNTLKAFKKWEKWDSKEKPNCSWVDSLNLFLQKMMEQKKPKHIKYIVDDYLGKWKFCKKCECYTRLNIKCNCEGE